MSKFKTQRIFGRRISGAIGRLGIVRPVRNAGRSIRIYLERFLPHSLYGRAALILIVPTAAVQLAISVSFIQRVFEDVTIQMTQNIVVEIDLLLDSVMRGEDLSRYVQLLNIAAQIGTGPRQDRVRYLDLPGATVIETLHERFPNLVAVDLVTDRRRVHLSLETTRGLLHLSFPRQRVTATNPHQLLVLIFFTTLLMIIVTYLFMRHQLRPIRELAKTSEAFGRGHHRDYRPSGSKEVRSAGETFLNMRERIEQHREQRTMMLSGISHDLRTPLTRLRLGLSLNEDTVDNRDMVTDLDEMERLIDSFLDFAGSEATEDPEPADLVAIVQSIVEKAARPGAAVSIDLLPAEAQVLVVKKLAIERALGNLVGNALRYGNRAVVSLEVDGTVVRFSVEDDGPGIPPDKHQEALKPFSRLDSSRNQNKGGGVGLGLPIVLDAALSHGGSLTLGVSRKYGGLLAVIELPVDANSANGGALDE